MTSLTKGFIWWLLRVLFGLNVILWGTVYLVHCQTPKKESLHSTQHTNRQQQEDEIRLMSVVVTEKNGNLVYLYRENKKLIEVTYLFWDEQSILKDPDAKPPYQFKGCYIMLYCLQHKYIYWLQREPCVNNDNSFYFKDGKAK